MKTKPITIFIIILILVFTAYLDSPYSFINKNYSYTASEQAVSRPMDQALSTETQDTEEKLVKKVKENGYMVETYREYDVYKDDNGNVTKEVPTSHYDELKYWDYKNKKK
ncbi:hypothetical protein [Bacillus sp. EB600]|uniref:hypothetical protein n=1 Tax=Bacillus sp. EB600 TaxID=2806345 RepID=UPI00210BA68B|nr:hypothetical protein [Bacillus sp. EB600]MCQ6282385.1 hypothetical protein [Bacillus sp. EB600]